MNRVLLSGGAAAVAVMTGACAASGDSPRQANVSPAGPGPSGPGGAGGGPVAYADFQGVTNEGRVAANLYGVHSTRVSTGRVVAAATAFLAALRPAQRAVTLFDIAADQWLNWSTVHDYPHKGLRLRDMTAPQRAAGLALLQAALSARGLRTSTNIRKLNHVAGRLLGRLDEFDEDLYYFTIMGRPSAGEPWGFQFQGHHLVINYFVLGDQVVMTPTFLGSEPRIGHYDDGTRIELFADEIAAGLALVNALDEAQRAKAVTSTTKNSSEVRTEAFQDNAVVPNIGVKAIDLTAAQRGQLLDLIGLFVGNMDNGHAGVKMAELNQHLAATYFSWAGPTGPDAAFYYRVQSPVILIEFDCQGGGPASGAVRPAADPANARATAVAPAPAGGPTSGEPTSGGPASAGPGGGGPSRDHIHSVVRTPNGNDYGFDLLKQHLAGHPHPTPG